MKISILLTLCFAVFFSDPAVSQPLCAISVVPATPVRDWDEATWLKFISEKIDALDAQPKAGIGGSGLKIAKEDFPFVLGKAGNPREIAYDALRGARQRVWYSHNNGVLEYSNLKYKTFARTSFEIGSLLIEQFSTKKFDGVPVHDTELLTNERRPNRAMKDVMDENIDEYLRPKFARSTEPAVVAATADFERRFLLGMADPDHPLSKFIKNRTHEMKTDRLNLLKEILTHVLPDYVRRRGWDASEKIDEFIKEAYDTLDRTSYTVIRRTVDGKLLGVVGLTYSAYGAVEVTGHGKTELVYGPMGSTAHTFHGYSIEGASQISDYVLNFAKNGSLHRLPTESVFKIDLARPLMADYMLPSKIALPDGREILPTVYRGMIAEPVKFWIDHSLLEREGKDEYRQAQETVVQELMSTMLFNPQPSLIQAQAYRLYTYGDPLSLRLYRPFGFVPMGTTKYQHDKNWQILVLSPEEIEQRLQLKTSDLFRMDKVLEATRQLLKPK